VRFEEEYPDCRLRPPSVDQSISQPTSQHTSPVSSYNFLTVPGMHPPISQEDDDFYHDEMHIKAPALSRQPSDASIHSRRALDAEEGHMHKLATLVQKQILEKQLCPSPPRAGSGGTPVTEATDREAENTCVIKPEHIQEIKMLVEGMDGEDIRQKVAEKGGPEGLIKKLEGVLNKEVAENGCD